MFDPRLHASNAPKGRRRNRRLPQPVPPQWALPSPDSTPPDAASGLDSLSRETGPRSIDLRASPCLDHRATGYDAVWNTALCTLVAGQPAERPAGVKTLTVWFVPLYATTFPPDALATFSTIV